MGRHSADLLCLALEPVPHSAHLRPDLSVLPAARLQIERLAHGDADLRLQHFGVGICPRLISASTRIAYVAPIGLHSLLAASPAQATPCCICGYRAGFRATDENQPDSSRPGGGDLPIRDRS